ncbi:MAG: hypothetical protein ACTSPX_02945 [Candidatus Thorarchaeota archaeon]
MTESRYIYGFHDPGGEYLMLQVGKPGWVLITEAIGHNPTHTSGRDYRLFADAGFDVIVRLNNGYYPHGTIPLPAYYDDFATRCANFVAASKGCHRWIIGNEPNHSQERPQGQAIKPWQYAECFRKCREAIRGAAVDQEVITAAIAPYNIQTGEWVWYLEAILHRVECDGIALHTYTWGSDPALITSEDRMDPPYDYRRKQFRAYQDFMAGIPRGKCHLPVYITETNQMNAWRNENNGWVRAAYQEIDAWNRQGGQQIHCLLLYRWGRYDKWSISDKPGVIEDFQEALDGDYRWYDDDGSKECDTLTRLKKLRDELDDIIACLEE